MELKEVLINKHHLQNNRCLNLKLNYKSRSLQSRNNKSLLNKMESNPAKCKLRKSYNSKQLNLLKRKRTKNQMRGKTALNQRKKKEPNHPHLINLHQHNNLKTHHPKLDKIKLSKVLQLHFKMIQMLHYNISSHQHQNNCNKLFRVLERWTSLSHPLASQWQEHSLYKKAIQMLV